MGEKIIPQLKTSYNRSISIQPGSDNVTSDAGALATREIMELAGITRFLDSRISDPRKQNRTVCSLEALLRVNIFLFSNGYTDLCDVNRLRGDPAVRLSHNGRRGVTPLADKNRLPCPSPL